MVNKRLVRFIESNNLFINFRCGFRRRSLTMDHMVELETSIREAIIQKQHLIAIFFDIRHMAYEKAYETTWRYGIMNDLHNIGLKSRLPNFIKAFLLDRKFRVCIGSTLSNIQNQEGRDPQGSILSVTLFNIKINSITNSLNPGVDKYLFFDDFCITSTSKYLYICIAKRQLQQGINKINKWTMINGFKISKTKSQYVNFCQLRKTHNNPTLNLDGSEIPVVDQYKFLGVIFDKKKTLFHSKREMSQNIKTPSCNTPQRLRYRPAHLAVVSYMEQSENPTSNHYRQSTMRDWDSS